MRYASDMDGLREGCQSLSEQVFVRYPSLPLGGHSDCRGLLVKKEGANLGVRSLMCILSNEQLCLLCLHPLCGLNLCLSSPWLLVRDHALKRLSGENFHVGCKCFASNEAEVS